MSRFVLEALFIAAKEGVKLSLCVFIVISLLRRADRKQLIGSVLVGIGIVFVSSIGAMSSEATIEMRETVSKLVGYVFGLFYIFSLAALFHMSGTNMLGPLKDVVVKKPVLFSLILFLTIIYFMPDMAGSSLYLKDLYYMSGRDLLVFIASGVVFFGAAGLSYVLFERAGVGVTRLFGLPQTLLMLSLVKLVAGGVRGFAEFSLIPSVQSGLMKLTHDAVHQMLVMLMVPDHPILSVTAWNYIGVLFGEGAGLWLSLLLFMLPLGIFLTQHFSAEPVVPAEAKSGAMRRKFIKAFRDERVLRSIPIFVFMLFIFSNWFVQKGDGAYRLYVPEPVPAATENGVVVIPIKSPSKDLSDGMLHKFSVSIGEESIRILVMKRPDGTLAVCLDACEICPPDGYGQGKGHVVCLYCNTPIPYETLGKPGGCNPIPLAALVTDKDIRIEMKEVSLKWSDVKTGKTRESIER